MNPRVTIYRFCGDIDIAHKYTNNPSACGALFVTDTNKVYITNSANEIIEVTNGVNDTIDTMNELINYINKETTDCKKHPTNCTNCGAVLTSNQCEYCGTIYR